MAWLDDLKSIAVAAGIPTGSVFRGANAVIPTGVGPYLSLISTGGSGFDRRQNPNADYLRPSAQIMSRASTYDAAFAQLKTFFDAVNNVENETVNGVWYVSIRPLQSDFIDLNPEEGTGRARLAFNVLGDRRP